jgi:hypothetical protein
LAGFSCLTIDEAEAAMCLWEECLLRRSQNQNDLFDWLRGGEGMADARSMCIEYATDIEQSWQIAYNEFGFDDSFDWEFVPRWADYAMELTQYQLLTANWRPYLAYKVTECWKQDTCRSFNSEDC